MIARTHRFHGHGSLRYVYKNGQIVRGPLSILKHARNDRAKSWRAAVVVSRKVHKSAVVRNRIRRRVYELIRLQLTTLEQPIDLVFIVHSETIATMPVPELERVVGDQLRKACLIHGIVERKEP